jgi:hypothetical protein
MSDLIERISLFIAKSPNRIDSFIEKTKPEDRIDEAEHQYGREGERTHQDVDRKKPVRIPTGEEAEIMRGDKDNWRVMNKQEKEPNREDWGDPLRGSSRGTCPNRMKHTSAFPAAHRELCPQCKKTYVNKPIKKSDELSEGTEDEMEHKDTIKEVAPKADTREVAKKIAEDHLKERPDYYDRLKEMEAEPVKKDLTHKEKKILLNKIKAGDPSLAEGIKTVMRQRKLVKKQIKQKTLTEWKKYYSDIKTEADLSPEEFAKKNSAGYTESYLKKYPYAPKYYQQAMKEAVSKPLEQ